MRKTLYDNRSAIVFDFDNTLFDYEKTEKEALKKACECAGIFYSHELFVIFHRINQYLWNKCENGKAFDKRILRTERFRILFKAIGVDCTESMIIKASDTYIIESCNGYLIENVEQTIKTLRKLPILIGIASSGFSYPRIDKLKNSAIHDCFDFVLFREDFDILKPDVSFYYEIKMHCGRENIIYIGDSFESDIIASKQAGLDNIWFNYNKVHISDKHLEFCDYIVTDFKEIVNIIFQEEL